MSGQRHKTTQRCFRGNRSKSCGRPHSHKSMSGGRPIPMQASVSPVLVWVGGSMPMWTLSHHRCFGVRRCGGAQQAQGTCQGEPRGSHDDRPPVGASDKREPCIMHRQRVKSRSGPKDPQSGITTRHDCKPLQRPSFIFRTKLQTQHWTGDGGMACGALECRARSVGVKAGGRCALAAVLRAAATSC